MTAGVFALVVVTASAFVAAWAGTDAARRFARRLGLLDPVEARRSHTSPTPRLGGFGVLAGVAVGLVAAWHLGAYPWSDAWPFQTIGIADPVLVGAASFFVVGFLDDVRVGRRGLPALAKLALQGSAAVAVVALGLRFHGAADGGGMAATRWPALAFADGSVVWTAIWIVAVVNLLNFMDGIDAIVATTAVVVLGAAAGWSWGRSGPIPVAGVGAVLGFAAWNAPPARIFLGDGGSHLVAFLVAVLPCAAPSTSAPVPWPLVAAPLLPSVVDVAEALVHKARHGIPMSVAHNDHLYQRLVKAGWSHGAVAIRYGVLALTGVVLAGPVAVRLGALGASAIGAAVLAVHLGTGARTTRGVPRLAKA